MSKQLETKPVKINSPAELLRVLNSEYTLTNDETIVAILKTSGFLDPTVLHSIHTNAFADSEINTVSFFETIADYLRDEDGVFAVVTVRGCNVDKVDADEVEDIFSEHHVLDIIQVDWTKKTWASDMCGDPGCCDQSMTQSFLKSEDAKPQLLDAILEQLANVGAVEESK